MENSENDFQEEVKKSIVKGMILEALVLIVIGSPDLRIPPSSYPSPISDVQEIPVPIKPQQSLNSVLFGLVSVAEASSSPPVVEECSCVEFVRKLIPKQFPKVNEAKDIEITSDKPSVGSVAVFSYLPSGHVSYVEEVGLKEFQVFEFNFKRCVETRRSIKIDDPFLIGFYR